MMHAAWSDDAPLPPGESTLLEASAGTGKTFQIANLVLRLVAEVGIGIERILTITFTKAATAELKGRIRVRLEDGRKALEGELGDPDPALSRLIEDESLRGERLARVERALAGFDLAPISTIHGFSQQMLSLFAFESGRERGLELCEDPDALIGEMVDDALAWAHAEESQATVALMKTLEWSRETLREIAHEVTGAVAPRIEPALVEDDTVLAGDDEVLAKGQAKLRENLATMLAEARAMRAWWASEEAQAALATMVERKGDLKSAQARYFASGHADVADWLRAPFGNELAGANWLRRAKIDESWRGKGKPEDAPWFVLVSRLEAFIARREELLFRTRPLLVFAHGLRRKLARELERRRLLTFDAMLSLLDEAIAAEGPEGRLAQGIRARYDVALVDEFQDTDSAQWRVLNAVFGPGQARRMFLIGDPKQAIYAFRGADIFVYLAAAETASRRFTMRTNWRSDGAYVDAMNALWREGSEVFDLPAEAGRAGIDYVAVDVPASAPEWALEIMPISEPGRGPNFASNSGQYTDDMPSPDIPTEDSSTYFGADARDARLGTTPTSAARSAANFGISSEEESELHAFQESENRSNSDTDREQTNLDPNCQSRSNRPFEVRWFDASLIPGEGLHHIGDKDRAKRVVARAVAREALALVSGAKVRDKKGGLADLSPGDLAVLVNSHEEARVVKRALDAVGLPSVLGKSGSVFGSDAAKWLWHWLRAVAGAGRDGAARVAVTTPAFGWTAQKLAFALTEEGAAEWSAWCDDLSQWSRDFERRGFIHTFEAACEKHGVMLRVLALKDGERHATDLRHVMELVHLHAGEVAGLGPEQLARWLDEEAPKERSERESDESRAQRLESDEKAITITTVHASKGLEYPVVLLPFAWLTPGAPGDGFIVWHDPTVPDGRPTLDLRHPRDPARQRAKEARDREHRQERIRLLYVMLTRAKHMTVAWLGPAGKEGRDVSASPLGALLLRSDSGERLPSFADEAEPAAMAAVAARLDALCAQSGDRIGWRREAPLGRRGAWSGAPSSATPRARPWLGPSELPRPNAVVSFTRIAGRSELTDEEPDREALPEVIDGLVAPEREAITEDEAPLPPDADATGSLGQPEGLGTNGANGTQGTNGANALGPPLHEPSHLEGMWGGKAVGVWLHGVFERLDFQTLADRDGRPSDEVIAEAARAAGIDAPADQLTRVTTAFPSIFKTSFGRGATGLPPTMSLADLSTTDRLDELRFDLRVDAGTSLPAEVLAALRLRLGESWSGARWLEAVCERAEDRPIFPTTNGLLIGAIDLVFRAPGDDGTPRYFIADYKTNRIIPAGEGRSLRLHYTAPWMAWEMGRHAYHLQALIYTVALHRHLALRVPDYDYDRHFGGHLYLFLRGMEGASAPIPDDGSRLGVFQDRWPREVVLAFDEALLRGGP